MNDGPDQVGNLNSLYWSLGELPEDTVLIYMSDDIDCPEQWDALLQSAILADARHAGQRFTVMVSDGTRTIEDPLQIVCIASAGYLQNKGYFIIRITSIFSATRSSQWRRTGMGAPSKPATS